jgi:hypothetical protein
VAVAVIVAVTVTLLFGRIFVLWRTENARERQIDEPTDSHDKGRPTSTKHQAAN